MAKEQYLDIYGVESFKTLIEEEIKEVDDKIGEVPDGKTVMDVVDAVQSNGYDDTELKELIEEKADAATTIAGYGITDAYTKTEVDTAIANADHLKRVIVTELPEVSDADANTIYMVEITGGSENQKYEEFMLINDSFEKIGDSAVDLTDYVKSEELEEVETRVGTLESLVGEGYEAIPVATIEALFTTT